MKQTAGTLQVTGKALESGAFTLWTLAMVLCGPRLEVGLAGPALRGSSCIRLAGPTPRSSFILAAVDLLVEDAGIRGKDLQRIVVSRGPGSFTGIRSGLATAFGLRAAVGAELLAYNSLLMQASRVEGAGEIMAAQPGRRGEVYAQRFQLEGRGICRPLGQTGIEKVERLSSELLWIAPEGLELGELPRAPVSRSAVEALLHLSFLKVPSEALEAYYVEGPPIHGSKNG